MTWAYLKHLVLCILKEYKVPLIDPCDPDYQGLDCGVSFNPGTCIPANVCRLPSFDMVQLIQNNTPPGNFLDGMVTLEIKINSISTGATTFVSDGVTRNVGTYYPYEDMQSVNLQLIGTSVITWEYKTTFISPTNMSERMIGPCTINIINNASAGDPGAITLC